MSEILNNVHRDDQELLESVQRKLAAKREAAAALIEQRRLQAIDAEAERIANMFPIGQAPTSWSEITAETAPYIPDVVRVMGQSGVIDFRSLEDQADRVASLKDRNIQFDQIEAVDMKPTYPQYSDALSGIVNDDSEKKHMFSRITRKQMMVRGGAVVALAVAVGGGGVVTNGYGTGVSIPGLSQDQSGAEVNIADGAAIAEPVSEEIAPSEAVVAPELKLSAGMIAIGDCLADETGEGKPLASATVSFGADQNYKLKTLTGDEELLIDENGAKPRVEIPEATINAAACIPSEAQKDALIVDGNKITINWDKIDRQLGIVPGGEGPTVDEWEMDAQPGVTDRATVTALNEAMRDPANQAAAVNIARFEFGKKVISETEPVIQQKLTEALENEVKGQVAALHDAKKAPTADVTIEFTGAPKPITYKGPAQDPVAAFEVVDVNADSWNFK